MRNILSKDVVAENEKAKVVLTYFGLGWNGNDYNPNDPDDEPVLYADLYIRIDDDHAEDFCDEPIESVCTFITADVTEDEAQRMVDKILHNLDITRFGKSKYEFLLDEAVRNVRDEWEW